VKRWVLSFVAVCCLAGCGYTTRAFVAQTGYRSISVAAFANKVDTTSEMSEGRRFQSTYPLLENRVTNAVIDRFIFDGSLKVVSEADADIVLKGEVVNYRRESLRNATDDTPQEYRLTIFVNLILASSKTGQVIWEKQGFAGDTSYYTTGQYVKSESQAVQDAVDDLARRIVNTTVEAW
jgi:hypothetical protein